MSEQGIVEEIVLARTGGSQTEELSEVVGVGVELKRRIKGVRRGSKAGRQDFNDGFAGLAFAFHFTPFQLTSLQSLLNNLPSVPFKALGPATVAEISSPTAP